MVMVENGCMATDGVSWAVSSPNRASIISFRYRGEQAETAAEATPANEAGVDGNLSLKIVP
jgi:hypothetical protein